MADNQENGSESDSKSARTRRRILDAAAQVLSNKGYAGLRLSDVADLAEVQAPAIYYYFSSREDLIEEVMWSGVAELRKHLEEALEKLPDGTTPLDRFTVAIEEHLRHELDLSNYATASIRNAGQVPQAIRERQVAEENAYGAIWADILRSAQSAGEIRGDIDVHTALMLVFGAMNWTGEWWDPERGDVDDLVTTAKAFILNGLAGS